MPEVEIIDIQSDIVTSPNYSAEEQSFETPKQESVEITIAHIEISDSLPDYEDVFEQPSCAPSMDQKLTSQASSGYSS